jgi:hypothetical protein
MRHPISVWTSLLWCVAILIGSLLATPGYKQPDDSEPPNPTGVFWAEAGSLDAVIGVYVSPPPGGRSLSVVRRATQLVLIMDENEILLMAVDLTHFRAVGSPLAGKLLRFRIDSLGTVVIYADAQPIGVKLPNA